MALTITVSGVTPKAARLATSSGERSRMHVGADAGAEMEVAGDGLDFGMGSHWHEWALARGHLEEHTSSARKARAASQPRKQASNARGGL